MGKKPDSEKPVTTWDGDLPGPGKVDHDGGKTQKFDLYTRRESHMNKDELQKGVDEGTAILLTPHAGQKVVFKFRGQHLTRDQAMEVKEGIQAIWGTEVPFIVIDESIDLYVASDEELRNP